MKPTILKATALILVLGLFNAQAIFFYLAYNPSKEWQNDLYFLSEKLYTLGSFILLLFFTPKNIKDTAVTNYFTISDFIIYSVVISGFRFIWVLLRVLGLGLLVDEKQSFYFIVSFAAVFLIIVINRIRKKWLR